MITIVEAGHAPHWERPAAFNQKVLQFLACARFPEDSQCALYFGDVQGAPSPGVLGLYPGR